MNKKIWYLCDGKKKDCKKDLCYKNTNGGPCRHTSDVEHAINFRKEGNAAYQSYREKDHSVKSGCDEMNDAAEYNLTDLP